MPISDYERLEQAKLAVKQAEDRFNLLRYNENEKYAEAIIEQFQSAKLSLNALIKELKANKSVIN